MQELTDFEAATIEQLANERGHDKPTAADELDAIALVRAWNKQRTALGLATWE